MEQFMQLSEKQQATIQKAIDLISPYDKEEVSTLTYYFLEEEDGDELLEYDCCDNEECIKKTEEELKKDFPNLETRYYHNDGDHENLSCCNQCGKPLHEQLTWIQQEFDHHVFHTTTLEDLTNSYNAFQLRCILQAIPSNDEGISIWAMNNEYENAKKRQDDFVKKVVDYAQLIIETIKAE